MAELLRSLQDSQLVARFQRRCGLFPAPEEGPRHNGAGPAEGAAAGRGAGAPAHGLRSVAAPQPYVQKYVVKNYFYYYLFRFSAALGQEVFYITFLPFTHWNIDPFLSRRLIIVWVYPFVLGLLMAVLFSTLVCLSRLYTGMHTVLDVLGGIAATAVLLALTYPAWSLIDRLDSASPVFPVCAAVVPFLLCYHYPAPDFYSPTRADTTTILAAGAGVTIGSWINHFFQLAAAPAPAPAPAPPPRPAGPPGLPLPPLPPRLPPWLSALAAGLALSLTKFAVGIALVLAVRRLVQALSLQLLCSWFRVVPRDREARRRLEIEVPYKFVTYASVGICATTFVPMLHRFLGLP
ncbi:sphingosine-1-phosphate phosphatase 2 isoform X4 [Canis aureus]